MNISKTEFSVIVAYRISMTPGGMIGEMRLDAAVTAAENARLKPLFSISGTSILHCMAASALEEPHRPPIKVDSRTFTCAMPPHICPTHKSANFIILEVIPVWFIKRPAVMKNGIAIRFIFMPPVTILDRTTFNGISGAINPK